MITIEEDSYLVVVNVAKRKLRESRLDPPLCVPNRTVQNGQIAVLTEHNVHLH